ncbi:type I secretion system permease/ATPase [Methylomonas montana]|uniref:type I secretion system permease/ATPase n=1 Tax=Methylomonas montana TaxID=3058963 RepID=UPI00265A3C89|nr:type I secretion system permease/ATPase [Methylomonas montana]WKJ91625.1 type I secretion system permease/ATPase [Methylomonas montana]
MNDTVNPENLNCHQRPLAGDPLREGLILLCRHFGHMASIAELGEGLALEYGRLPLSLAPRALRRAGITARVVEYPLKDISPRLLPALLLLKDGRSLLLVEWHAEQALLLEPESDGGQQSMSLTELDSLYSGTALFARPRYRPDERAGDFAREEPAHWLKGPLRASWRDYIVVGIAALMSNMLAISSALFGMQVYDRVVPNEAFDTLWILASGVAVAIVLEFVLRTLRAHMLDVTGKRLDLLLSSRLFEQVLQIRLQSKPASMGAFSSQVREFESVREFMTSTTISVISDIPFVLLFLGVIFLIGGPVVWVPFTAVWLMLLPGLLTQRSLARLSRQHLREGAIKNGVLLEAIENLETIKSSRAEGRLLQQWENLTAELSAAAVTARSITALLGYAASLTQQLCYVGVIIVGVYQISAGEMTVGALFACSILASRTIAPIAQIAGILARWQHVKVAMEGLDGLMSAPTERPQGRRFARSHTLRGHYVLEEVRLNYQSDGPPALNITKLEFQPGKHVALLGGNGAGKSTLLRLLSGLITPSEGRILLEDLSIGQIDPADLRQAIGYLPQDTALFYGTLRDNLIPDNAGQNDDELFAALDGVGLGAFVRAHPLGLDMLLEGNNSVSGGQRQAIALARLLLQDPRIVLLDEPTAAFDNENEARVVEYLQHWLKGRTLILSTHKRALLALTERAVVLRQGRVVMDGPLSHVVNGNQVKIPEGNL